MNRRSIGSVMGGVVALLLSLSGPVGAASLTLVPSSATVGSGASFFVDVVLNPGVGPPVPVPAAWGGEIVVDFDPTQLRYDGFSLAPGLAYFKEPVTGTAGGRRTVNLGFDNWPGSNTVGRFSFTALSAPGVVAGIGLADADDFFGTFISYPGGYDPFHPGFAGTQVSTVVPLPGTAWLVGTAAAAFGLSRQRRRNHR